MKTLAEMKKKVVEKVITKRVTNYEKRYWLLFYYYVSMIQK